MFKAAMLASYVLQSAWYHGVSLFNDLAREPIRDEKTTSAERGICEGPAGRLQSGLRIFKILKKLSLIRLGYTEKRSLINSLLDSLIYSVITILVLVNSSTHIKLTLGLIILLSNRSTLARDILNMK